MVIPITLRKKIADFDPFVMAALALVTGMSADSTQPRNLMVGAGGFALLRTP